MAKAASPSSSNSFGLSLDEEGMAELLEMMDTAEAQQGPQKRKPTAPPDGQPAAAAGAQCGRSTGGTKVRRVGSPPGSGAGERCDHHHLPAPADAEGDGTMADVAVETAARTASDEERMGPAGASRSDMVAHSDPLDISEFIPRGELCDHYRKAGIHTLHQWQAEALRTGGAMDGGSLVFTAPTSGGKTLVAEILLVRSYLRTGKKAIMVLPYVSIVTEKSAWLKKVLAPSGYRVEAFHGIQGGDIAKADLAICTMEKANALVNRMAKENQMGEVGIVVVDEMHMLGDESRGYLLELLMTKVKYIGRSEPIQFVGMSATLPNITQLSTWIGASLYETDYRPVPLTEFVKIGSTIFEHKGQGLLKVRARVPNAHPRDTEHVVALCNEVIREGNGTLVFCSSKRGCQSTAKMISEVLTEVMAQEQREWDSTMIEKREILLNNLRRTPGSLDETLQQTVPQGVAYHNAGMTIEERELVESAFREGLILVLTATSTLAAGVNLPAKRVIFRQPYIGNQFLDATRYKQMCGRAGRAGHDKIGESFLIVEQRDMKKAKDLLVEPLKKCTSALCADKIGLSRAVLEVIAAEIVATSNDVELWLKCTLFYEQCGQTSEGYEKVHQTCKDALEYLEKKGFIKWHGGNLQRFSPSPFGTATFLSSLPPRDAMIVAKDLNQARRCFILSSPLHLLYQVTPVTGNPDPPWRSYADIFHRWTSSEDKKVAEQIGIAEQKLFSFSRNPPKFGTSDNDPTLLKYKRFYAAMVLNYLVKENSVGKVASQFEIQRGSLQMLQDKAATFAKMVSQFCQRLNWWDLEVLTNSYAKQLNYGCQADVLPLFEIRAIKGPTARALFKAGLRSVAAVAMSSEAAILQALSANSAFKLRRDSGSDEKALKTIQHHYEKDKNLARAILKGATGLIRQQAAELNQSLVTHAAALEPEAPPATATDHASTATSQPPKQLLHLPEGGGSGPAVGSPRLAASSPAFFGDRERHGNCTCVCVTTKNECEQFWQLVDRHGKDRFGWSVVTGSRRSALAPIFTKGVSVSGKTGTVKTDTLVLHGVCICWSEQEAYYVACIDNDAMREKLLSLICTSPNQKVSFDMKQGLHAISAVTQEPASQLQGEPMDPQLAAWMLDPDIAIAKLDLRQLLKTYGCPPMTLSMMRSWNACVHTCSAFGLMRKLDALLEEQQLHEPFVQTQMKMYPVWVHMELGGFGYDKAQGLEYDKQLAAAVAALEKLAHQQAGKTFELTSPKQVGQVLYQHLQLAPNPKTKVKEGKLPSTDRENLDWLIKNHAHPVLPTIKTHRQLSKLLSTFVRPLLQVAEANKTWSAKDLGPRIHPKLHQFGVPTGRVSMDESANLQCIPKPQSHELRDEGGTSHTLDIAIRRTFVAAPGHMLLAADYSQVELRLMAHFSKDESLIAAFHSSQDVFRVMAGRWLGKEPAAVTDEERSRAKTLSYGTLYGAGKVTLAKNLNIRESEAETLKNSLLTKYPRIKEYPKLVESECKSRGYVETLIGRRRRFPHINSRDSHQQAAALRAAVNTICQGSAADLLNIATLAIFEQFCEPGAEIPVRIVNQVHDELILEVPEKDLDTVVPLVRAAMEKPVGLLVPMKVNIKVGPNWEDVTDRCASPS